MSKNFNIKELLNLSVEDLNKKLNDEQTQLLKLKLSLSVSALDKPLQIKEKRRDIARICTVLTQKAHA